jgi:uncharacterized phage-associated protein
MAARLDSVCKYICERGGWRLSNLQLQKILYMAQMYFMGLNEGARLVDTRFEAWNYGPVSPTLYHKVKAFGSDPIKDVFFEARNFSKDDERRLVLNEVCDDLLSKRPGELVNITHWDSGAWAKHYVPDARGIEIPDKDIFREYRDRVQQFGNKAA